MVALGPKLQPPRKGSLTNLPGSLLEEIRKLETAFTVNRAKLKQITEHFVNELEAGLEKNGENIPMNPTWVMGFPDGSEQGTILALDMGGTNLRVCRVILTEEKGAFEIIQSKYRIPESLKAGTAHELWEYIADCLEQFIHHYLIDNQNVLPLGFTFSYPTTQDYINHGVLQTWTKGFDISGLEGADIVSHFQSVLDAKNLPIKVTALINDTTGTLIASAYADPTMRIGCVFGTGCNAAYMENCGSIPKLKHRGLPSDMPIAINCEYGAFDSDRKVLPITKYDAILDERSHRPGRQLFEKMTSGRYLGEIFRLVLVDLSQSSRLIFDGQDISLLKNPYALDTSVLACIEEDPFENLQETHELLLKKIKISASQPELELCRRLAELIGIRSARLSMCGVAAICRKKNIEACHIGADGSVFTKYPHFRSRAAIALREILDWSDEQEDPIIMLPSEDGSGVGAALIAALTLKMVKEGNLAGVHEAHKFDAWIK